MPNYTARVGKIYVSALTTSWTQVLTKDQAKAILGFKIKMRFLKGQAPAFFQIAFQNTPDQTAPSEGATTDGDGIYTLSGSGSGDMSSPSNGVYARVRDSGDSGKLCEILTWG